ncbi:venom dipeptidyl peptidase 4-like isoform X2 [Harmonia axyridis]|uniref:venom dipeptidyl peptidase 4-like isoform X2 n=1 Tax=Harmonia axyridis TaxID=115357 RepID=UPI001E2787B2|nr:venom dipeptidyl peptidase 4-like isoform X2 [Harmonia axyridis]
MEKMTGRSNNATNMEIGQSNQDLISNKSRIKTKRWIIAGVIIFLVVALVVASLVLLKTSEDFEIKPAALTSKRSLSLEDFLYGKFFAQGFNGTWISGSELMFQDANNNLVIHDIRGDNSSQRVLLSTNDPISLRSYVPELSADKKYLLVAQIQAQLYRHSKVSRYTVINLETDERIPITIEGNSDLLLVVWAPVGYGLAVVYKNNLFYKENPKAQEVRITNDPEFVYNGVPDWVYEEEVLSSNKALWFSPDGKKLAFGKFDDRPVPLMVIPYFGEPGTKASQYPRVNAVKYPKAGTANPIASLHSVDLSDLTNIKILQPPSSLAAQQPILSAVQWANNDTVAAIWLNRVQNESSFIAYGVNVPYQSFILKNLAEPAGWLELFTPMKFNQNGSQYIIILSHDQGGDAGAFRHVMMFNTTENAKGVPLTTGKFVVTEILGWDETDDLVYYTANTPEDPAVQHVYSISTTTKKVTCLSCGMSRRNSTNDCLYNTAQFSSDFSHYALICQGPDVPFIEIRSKDNNQVLKWENNDDLYRFTRTREMPVIRRMQFNVSEGFTAQVTLQLPPNFDESGDTKYPLLINVYAGPDSSQVSEEFTLNWGSYLASNRSFIYGVIDGRGSALKGDKYLFAGYRNLGTVEVEDQILVTKKMQDTLPYIDRDRTAIWGWSYGGYAAGMALATETDNVFKCGISVAPVTDWALYDTIYTERFMGLPNLDDNLRGYLNAQLLTKYAGIRDKLYFLIHGTYDDNVHYQQSLLWAKVLEQQDIFFRQMTYTDQVHDLGSVRPHLYHSLENFLDECFNVIYPSLG